MMYDGPPLGIPDTICIDDLVDYIMELDTHEEIIQLIQEMEKKNIVITERQNNPRMS